MPDSSWLGALPLGLLFILGTFLARHRRRLAQKRAARELPDLAAEWGLQHRSAGHAGGVGKLGGQLGGFRVWVDPEEGARVRVYFSAPIAISMRTYQHQRRAPLGWERFDSEQQALNDFFVERYASSELADVLFELRDLGGSIQRVRRAVKGRLKSMAITSDGIDCQLNYEKPAYIPAATLRALVPALIDLATLLETVHEELAPAPTPLNSTSTAP